MKYLFIAIFFSAQVLATHDCEPKNRRESQLLELSYEELSTEFVNLINQGVNPNVCDRYRSTPLSTATFWFQNKMAAYLINHPKVDINYVDQWGWPPLAFAVARGNLDILEKLLKSPRLKFDIEIPRGQNIFHISAYNDPNPHDIAAAKLILNYANPKLLNHKNARGFTPLHFAIRRDKAEMVKLLLSTKLIDLSITDPDGRSYLDFAIAENRPEIAVILESLE